MKIKNIALSAAALLLPVCALVSLCSCSLSPLVSNLSSSANQSSTSINLSTDNSKEYEFNSEEFEKYFKIFATHFPFAAYTQEDYENKDYYESALYGIFEIACFTQNTRSTPFSSEENGCINIPKDIATKVATEMFSFSFDLSGAEEYPWFTSPRENCFGFSAAHGYGEIENKITSAPFIDNGDIIICTELIQKGYDNTPDTSINTLMYTFDINENYTYVPYKLKQIKKQ